MWNASSSSSHPSLPLPTLPPPLPLTLLVTVAHWLGSQKNGTLKNGLLIVNSAARQWIPSIMDLSQAGLPSGSGQAGLRVAPLSVTAPRTVIFNTKWPKTMSQNFKFRTNVHCGQSLWGNEIPWFSVSSQKSLGMILKRFLSGEFALGKVYKL